MRGSTIYDSGKVIQEVKKQGNFQRNNESKEKHGKLSSEIVPFNLEGDPVMHVAFHDFLNCFGQAHAEECVAYLCMAVYLTEFEQTTRYLCRVLARCKRTKLKAKNLI